MAQSLVFVVDRMLDHHRQEVDLGAWIKRNQAMTLPSLPADEQNWPRGWSASMKQAVSFCPATQI
jgi:hypothetical protein